MITGRVVRIDEPGRVVFDQERIYPERIKPDELLCETIVTAISPGTELAAFSGARPLRPDTGYPRIVGYCNVGRVVRCGDDVDDYLPGDRVLSFTSHRSHFVIPARDVLAKLSQTIPDEDAACAYLFHLGYNAVLVGGVRLGSTVVVLGLGVVGLCTVALAVGAGARVFCLSDYERPRECALSMGAAGCHSRTELAALLSALGPDRAQVVVTTTNSWADWQRALELTAMRAKIVVVGFPGRDESPITSNPLDSRYFYSRQLQIVAAGMSPEYPDSRGFLPFNERDNLSRILSWIENGVLNPSTIVSGELPAEDIGLAYRQLMERKDSPITFLLRWAS